MIHNLGPLHYKARTALLVLSLCLMARAQSETKQDSGAFQYELEEGKILYYTSRAKSEYTRGVLDLKETLEIWVLHQNADASWRLLLKNHAYATKTEGRGKSEELPESSGWAFCEFSPDGRYTRNWAMDNLALFDLFLPNIFPVLPDDLSKESLRWESSDRLYGESTRFTAGKPNPDERSWVIALDHMTPLDDVYLMSQRADVYIDLLKGIPIYKKGESIRGYGYYAGKTSGTVLLDSIVDLNKQYAERYAREMETFLTADSAYNHILEDAEDHPTKLTLARSSAEYLLSQARSRITMPEIRTKLNKMIDELPVDFEHITDRIKRRTKLVNKPAPRWRVEDFAGNRISMEDLLGNVILLDFWYRACPWCLRSMPLIDEVARYFEGRPVVVLGVNTDKERDDALFVIEKMNPTYNNLSGRDLIKKYGVTNYPTFIIIDRNGLVRRIKIGYESDLADKIIEIIESLL